MNLTFAHAGEVHESALESTSHAIPWYVQILLFIVIAFGLYTILSLLIKKKDVVLLILATIFLVVGFGLYVYTPIVSVIAITTGLFSTLVVTLTSLAPAENQIKPKGK